MRLVDDLLVCSITATLLLATTGNVRADPDTTLDDLIRSHLQSRGVEVQVAPSHQLARRYAIDLNGVVPSPADVRAVDGKTPAEMFEYFRSKGPMPHTAGEVPYVWINLLNDADHFFFSNSNMFSQVAHIQDFRDQLAKVYRGELGYLELTRWALRSQMFLNRFPSAADRANAIFFLFLGRDSLSSEVPFGNMWNGYRLKDRRIRAQEAETNPDYHVYVYDEALCRTGRVSCTSELWSRAGSTPDDAIEMIVGSPLFAEAIVDRYWARYMKQRLPGIDFPEVRKLLVRGLVAADYDINWLIREIATSAAYTQEAMFR